MWRIRSNVENITTGDNPALALWGSALHFPSGAMLCTSPLGLCSILPLLGCGLCFPSGMYSALPLWGCALPRRGTVLCPENLGHCASALPFWALCSALPLWGSVICTALLGCCTLHCPSVAFLCTALLGHFTLHYPSGGMICTVPFGHCAFGLPFLALTALPSVALYSALSFLGTVLCTALFGPVRLPCSSGAP